MFYNLKFDSSWGTGNIQMEVKTFHIHVRQLNAASLIISEMTGLQDNISVIKREDIGEMCVV